MLRTASLLLTAVGVFAIGASNLTAAPDTTPTPHIGEVKAIVLDPTNGPELKGLREQGWVEAGGQLVSIHEFPALYRSIGRRWTPPRASSDTFALPDLEPAHDRLHVQNPYGVLGPGDLVAGGHEVSETTMPSLLYFIYVGEAGH